jgi:hypothetical protein
MCPNVTKYFFLPKRKMHFSKKLQFFSLRKGNLWRKILFYFFESSNSSFWENSPWNKLVRFWVGWVILFYFISNLMTFAKNIINFQFTIYMYISLFLCPVEINRPWRDRWMIGRMWSIISSIYPIIAGLWHVCHLFLLLFSSCCVCIPLFLRPIGINRPWQDGWMDDEIDGWNDASWCPLLYVTSLNPVPNAQRCVYLTVHITKLQLQTTFPKLHYIWHSTCIHWDPGPWKSWCLHCLWPMK